MRRLVAVAAVIGALVGGAYGQGVFETAYYQVATDLSRDQAREAYVRLDRMYEQFEADFAWLRKRPREGEQPKFKAVLYTDKGVYMQAGGSTIADACYSPSRRALLVYFDSETDWKSVVHEGCHQYIAEVIRGQWPTFFNEGVATYYGYSHFGGDRYLPGVVLSYYVTLNRELVTNKKLIPFDRLFTMSARQWQATYSAENYHQSWMYVHYMLHSNEQNRRSFEQFVQALADGEDAVAAWRAAVPDQRAFLSGWNRYWGQASVDNEREWRQRQIVLLTAAGVQRVNASYGRRVGDLEAYFRGWQSGQIRLKETPETWLPPGLLLDAAAERDQTGRWSLGYDTDGLPIVRLLRRDAPPLEARYERVGETHQAVLHVGRSPQ